MFDDAHFRHLGGGRKGLFLLLRYVFIIAASYLVIFQTPRGTASPMHAVMIAVALASNVALSRISPRNLFAWYVEAPVLIADTLWVSWALHSTGAVGQEFFLLYFFVLFLAATTNSLVMVVFGTVLTSAANVYFVAPTGVWTAPHLLRIVFFFTVALFYSHVLREIKRERLRADKGFAWARELETTVAERTAALRRLYEQSRAASSAKSDFVANMSHELRTPLNIVMGYADMLLDPVAPPGEEERERLLRRIRQAAGGLLQLVNSVLDLGKLESGKMPVTVQPVPLDRFAVEIQRREHVTPATDVELCWDVPESLPVVETDPDKLAIVLDNLMNNALKFTRQGAVTVSISDLAPRELVEFRVADTGPGIDTDDQPLIFEPFHQLDGAHGKRGGGVGLGLAIVRSYVELLGGDVNVQSSVGDGTTFRVRLPYRWTESRTHTAAARPGRALFTPDEDVPPAPDGRAERSAANARSLLAARRARSAAG